MKWFFQRHGTHPTTWTHSTHCQRSHATVDMCGCHITVKLAAQIFGCQRPFHVSHLIRNSSSFLWYAIIFWKFPQNSCESVKILLKFNRLATFIVGAYKKLWKIRKIYVDDWRWKFSPIHIDLELERLSVVAVFWHFIVHATLSLWLTKKKKNSRSHAPAPQFLRAIEFIRCN